MIPDQEAFTAVPFQLSNGQVHNGSNMIVESRVYSSRLYQELETPVMKLKLKPTRSDQGCHSHGKIPGLWF